MTNVEARRWIWDAFSAGVDVETRDKLHETLAVLSDESLQAEVEELRAKLEAREGL